MGKYLYISKRSVIKYLAIGIVAISTTLLLKVDREEIVDFVNLCRSYPRTVKGFDLSHMTIYVAYSHNVNYCDLLSKSMDGDKNAFDEFVAAIDSLDGVYAYDHCMRVSKVAESLDEKTLQSYLSQSNKQELYKLWNCLDCTISFQDEYDLSTKEIKKIEKIMKLIEMRMEKL